MNQVKDLWLTVNVRVNMGPHHPSTHGVLRLIGRPCTGGDRLPLDR